jgi:hypothetical protein
MVTDPTNEEVGGIANERGIGVTNEWASSIIEGDTSMLLMLFCLEIHETRIICIEICKLFFHLSQNKD